MSENHFTKEDIEKRKKDIFDSMGPRNKKRILKKGYEKWNPFEDPKDPIDIRKDNTKRTTQDLMKDFMKSSYNTDYNEAYASGIYEMALGIMTNNEKVRGMFDFSCWYKEILKESGKTNLTE